MLPYLEKTKVSKIYHAHQKVRLKSCQQDPADQIEKKQLNEKKIKEKKTA